MSNEIEYTFLSQLMTDTKILYEANIKEDHFENYQSKKIFRVIKACEKENIKPNIQIILSKDRSIKMDALSNIELHSTANWKYYYNEIIEKYKQTELRKIYLSMKDAENKLKSSEIINLVQDKLNDIMLDSDSDKVVSMREASMKFLGELEKRYNSKGAIPGLHTGYTNLDNVIMGFQEKKMYVIGARPSQGKSAFLLNLASNVARNKDKKIGFISAESSVLELVQRIYASESCIDSQVLSTGMFSRAVFDKIYNITEQLCESNNIFFKFKAGMTLDEYRFSAKYLVEKHGCDIIFVDYLQHIRNERKKEQYLQIGEVSTETKRLASTLDIPIVIAAQLNRNSDQKRPTQGDLKGSSQIEQDADFILLIWKFLDKEDQEKIIWIIDKNRDGKTCDIPIYFNKKSVRFTEITRSE